MMYLLTRTRVQWGVIKHPKWTMTPEERQRLKEKELAHLRELQRLKRLARHSKRQNRLNKALANITGALDQVTGHSDSLLPELELENARTQARLDLAMEARTGSTKSEASTPQSTAASAADEPTEPTAKTIGSHLRTPPSETDQEA